MRKSRQILVLAACCVFALAACGATAPESEAQPDEPQGEALETTRYTNEGMILSVPVEYDDLVQVETPRDGEEGAIFSVSEKESMKWGEKQHPGEDWGAGWLFDIEKIGEKALHEMLCYDMSGAIPFARDRGGSYYVFTHPTDVRLVRESYDFDSQSEDIEQWTALNAWAETVRERFLEDNPGLTRCTFTNTPVDMCLYQLAYQEDVFYTIGTPVYGSLLPKDVDKQPYMEQLLDGVTFELADSSQTPDGEFVVLDLPERGERLDFFRAEGNYVREISDGTETLYRADYAGKEFSAAQLMSDWYDALAEANF